MLQVLSATLNGFINCACNHLTSFGGGLIVKPNPIDFDRVVVEFMLLHDTGNIAVIVTVSMIFLFYLIVLVVARKADKGDQKNVSIFNDVMKSGRFGNNGGVGEVAEDDGGIVKAEQRVVEGGQGVVEVVR